MRRATDNPKDFLGRGWRFPVAIDPASGSIAMSEFERDIRESITIILSTAPIDRRKQSDIVARLKKMVPHFPPEWSPSEEDPGAALINIFAFLTQQTLVRLNQAPLRNMLAFLDLLGVRLAPKTPAQAF